MIYLIKHELTQFQVISFQVWVVYVHFHFRESFESQFSPSNPTFSISFHWLIPSDCWPNSSDSQQLNRPLSSDSSTNPQTDSNSISTSNLDQPSHHHLFSSPTITAPPISNYSPKALIDLSLVLPPTPAPKPRHQIIFPRPFRHQLNLHECLRRQAIKTPLPKTPPPHSIQLPLSPPPQSIPLPLSPPPQFDFSHLESSLDRSDINLLDSSVLHPLDSLHTLFTTHTVTHHADLRSFLPCFFFLLFFSSYCNYHHHQNRYSRHDRPDRPGRPLTYVPHTFDQSDMWSDRGSPAYCTSQVRSSTSTIYPKALPNLLITRAHIIPSRLYHRRPSRRDRFCSLHYSQVHSQMFTAHRDGEASWSDLTFLKSIVSSLPSRYASWSWLQISFVIKQ